MKKLVIFDIAPEAIRVTLTEHSGDAFPKIVGAEYFPVPWNTTTPTFGVAHLDKLRQAYAQIPADHLRRARVHTILHSPFAVARLRSTGRIFFEPTVITQEILNAVSASGEEHFTPSLPLVRLERKIFLTKLNGYSVNQPLGRRAHELSLSLCESYLGEEAYQKITSLVGGDFHTLPLIILPVVRDILGKGSDVTLIHIGSLSTDVGVVRGGVLAGVRSFPRGSRAFALRLQEKLAPSFSEAESLARLFIEKALAPDARESVAKVYEDVRRMWLGELVGADRPTTGTVLMPRKTVLFGDPMGVVLYQDLLASEASGRGVLEGTRFDVDILSPRTLAGFLTIPQGVLPDIYHFLSALCMTSV